MMIGYEMSTDETHNPGVQSWRVQGAKLFILNFFFGKFFIYFSRNFITLIHLAVHLYTLDMKNVGSAFSFLLAEPFS